MNYLLIGFKSSGKTKVGQKLAELMKTNFIDLDDVIEKLYEQKHGEKLTFREIYKKNGKDFFRNFEKDALKSIENTEHTVIALGGATIFDKDNLRLAKSMGKLIFLLEDKEVIYERIMKNGTPAFFDPENPRESFEKIYADRLDKYYDSADVIIDRRNKDVEATAQEIIEDLHIYT